MCHDNTFRNWTEPQDRTSDHAACGLSQAAVARGPLDRRDGQASLSRQSSCSRALQPSLPRRSRSGWRSGSPSISATKRIVGKQPFIVKEKCHETCRASLPRTEFANSALHDRKRQPGELGRPGPITAFAADFSSIAPKHSSSQCLKMAIGRKRSSWFQGFLSSI